jgi:eukaryotic-like serine/threonine-protein kinase
MPRKASRVLRAPPVVTSVVTRQEGVAFSTMPLGRGDTFGRYVVEEVLGAGGGGEVYRAHDSLLHRAVALKVLLPSAVDTAEGGQRTRILREARAAAQLSHPNVVAIFDVGDHDGVPYMAMELVPGRSLRAYIGADDVPMARRLRWLSDIALALDAAHKHGLIHRDVKPENVIVRDDGMIKVVDFGIARQTVVDPGGPTALERTGTASAGTPHYMAPEQIRNEPLDGRADQFGWGVTAYELVSGGSLPWDSSGGALKYVASVVGEDATPLLDHGRAIAPEVAVVIERALCRTREERFATMEEVAHALDPLRSHSGPDVVRHVVSVLPPQGDLGHQVTTKAPVSGKRTELEPLPSRPSLGSLRRARRKVWGIALLAVVAIMSVMGALRRRAHHPHPSTAASEAASLAPTPIPVTSSALPTTANREALAAYTEGLQALRDGASYAAQERFAAAAKLDPMLAGAELRVAVLYLDRDLAKARASYVRAHELRSVLGGHDQALLDAIEPIVARTVADAPESERRLSALAERYPADVEILYYLELAAGQAADFSLEGATGERALALDPDFHAVLGPMAESQAYSGDLDQALRTLDRCLEKAPASNACLALRNLILEQRGECGRVEHDSRQFLAANPSAGPVYGALAEGMMSMHAPALAVRQALEQQIAAVREADRPRSSSAAFFRFHVATGALDAAEKDAHDYAEQIAQNPSATLHAVAAKRLVELYAETGRVKEAGEVARGLLDRKDGYTRDARVDNEGISYDATPSMLATERAAGLLDEHAFLATRNEWLAGWEARSPAFFRGYLWLQAYPYGVVGADEARDALAALDRYGGVPPFRPQASALIGRVYLLAGRLEEAMPWLEADARCCDALNRPFDHVHAVYWLARGYEAKGDVASACASYSDVLDCWGDARPRSVTADDARKHAKALHCAPGGRDRGRDRERNR